MLIAVSTIFGAEIIVTDYQVGEGEQPVEELEQHNHKQGNLFS